MKPQEYFTRNFLLPELNLIYVKALTPGSTLIAMAKAKTGAVCPKCAALSLVIYDKRYVRLKDSPVYGRKITLQVLKHRYFCKPCKRPFTEPLPGLMPRRRTTQRLRKNIYWACENFSDLKKVCRAYRVSQGFVYRAYYEQLSLRARKHHQYPFSSFIGIDEHCFGRKKGAQKREFVTMVVDHNKKKLFDVTLGKSHADRFHVQRLMNPILHQARIEITGDKRKNPARILLNKNRCNLKPWERSALDQWLKANPKINEVYQFKEAIGRMYRIRGVRRAEAVFDDLVNELEKSENKLLRTLKTTFKRWREEILNFFRYRLTNARVEGFNNVAKVIKRRAYGFRSFENDKLRLLNACS